MTAAEILPPSGSILDQGKSPILYQEGRDLSPLFQPFQLGPLRLPNRVIIPAMETNLAGRSGEITDRLIEYYLERVRGEAAYITTENTSVHPSGMVTDKMLRIDHDGLTEGFRRLVEAVHKERGRILIQLSHAGRQTLSDFTSGSLVAPSPLPCPVMKEVPKELTGEEIGELVAAFGAGARRAREAGADGVELHMAHGYLLCGFLSPYSNVRSDEYGGSVSKRALFPSQVVRAVREALGPHRALVCRISADERVPGGLIPDDAIQIGRILMEAGADGLHVSACNYESMFWNMPSYFLPEGSFEPLAARMKRELGVPIIAVGRIHRPELAAHILSQGHADLVAMGRATIADPHLVRKARLGLPIRPCLACNRCIASISGGPLECTVNPILVSHDSGSESDLKSSSFNSLRSAPLRMMVVGGGPAGLATAIAAIDSRFQVTLVEKRPHLGGQLDLASMPPHKEPVAWYRDYLLAEVKRRPIQVVTGRELDGELLLQVDPQVVVLATGSRPRTLSFLDPGGIPIIDADSAMRNPSLAGPRPVVVGGGAGGCEAAHYLASQGCHATVLERKRKVAMDLNPPVRFHLERSLREDGVSVFTQVQSVQVDRGVVLVQVAREGTHRLEGVSAFIAAAGREPVLPESPVLTSYTGMVVSVGDASRPRSIFEAVTDALRTVERLDRQLFTQDSTLDLAGDSLTFPPQEAS